MTYSVGQPVWVYVHARRLSSEVSQWRPGVVVGPAREFCGMTFYAVEVDGVPPPAGSYWLARPVDLRPRDDGRDRGAWSNCAWRPRQVPA